MPIASEALYERIPVEAPRKRWTRQDCAVLEAAGLLAGQSLELIDGELIDKMGKKRPHTNTLSQVLAWLIAVFGADYVNPETPIDVAPEDDPTNEPQPDAIVLNRPSRDIVAQNPRPSDLRLVVEVSDTSLGLDLKTKARLYARSGIVDYWVFDVSNSRLIVHREPAAGQYKSVIAYAAQEQVAPLAAPNSPFPVASAFR